MMHDHLSDEEKRELSVLLDSPARYTAGSPKEKENNRVEMLDLASLSLTKMPVVR